MMSETNVQLVDWQVLKRFSQAVFEKLGVPQEDAELTADTLVMANLRGVDSHGVIRLKVYSQRIKGGGVSITAPIDIVQETPASALMDGGARLGQVVAVKAIELAMAKAKEVGAGVVAVRNGSHLGACAYFPMLALEEDMVGVTLSNSLATMVAWGGLERVLGNNPFAVAIPAGEERPIVLDMACGTVAWGKVFVAAQKGESIPGDWVLDKEGDPTTDPQRAWEGGFMLPFGQHKGYGISLVVNILTGLLSGGSVSTEIVDMYSDLARPQDVCYLMGALDIARFVPLEQFKSRMDELIRTMRGSKKREGVERIYVPGEKEFLEEEKRRKEGIPLPVAQIAEFKKMAQELDLEAPF